MQRQDRGNLRVDAYRKESLAQKRGIFIAASNENEFLPETAAFVVHCLR